MAEGFFLVSKPGMARVLKARPRMLQKLFAGFDKILKKVSRVQ